MDKRRAALLTVTGGVIIFALKLSAWYISNSIALLSDALESIVNILASLMMFWSIVKYQIVYLLHMVDQLNINFMVNCLHTHSENGMRE